MSNSISHEGIIESVQDDVVHVRIVQSSACANCKIAEHCTSAESKEKVVDVVSDRASQYVSGQEVMVYASAAVGMKAVVLAFVIPGFLLMMAVIATLAAGASELSAALYGLVALIPYYIIIYVLRGYLKRELVFTLE